VELNAIKRYICSINRNYQDKRPQKDFFYLIVLITMSNHRREKFFASFPIDKSITPPAESCTSKYQYNPTNNSIAAVPQTSAYFYSVTGDLQVGNNQNQSEFDYSKSRFTMDQPLDIVTQGMSWNSTGNVNGEASPFFELKGQTGAPNITLNEYNVPVSNNNWANLQ
jgi:hypothetical protein